MWNVLGTRLAGITRIGKGLAAKGADLREIPERVRTSVRLSQQSGMMWSLTTPGVVELARVLASGSQNPSLIYRVNARNSPSKPALIWRGRTTSWAELDSR